MWSYSEFSSLSESAESLKLSKENKYKSFSKVFDVKTEKEKKKTSSKVLLLLFQTWGNQPCFRTADALWGLRWDLPQLPQPTFKCLHPCTHFHFLLCHPSKGWVSHCSLYFTTTSWSSTSSVAGLEGQARCEQEWLVEWKGGEMEAKKEMLITFWTISLLHFKMGNLSLCHLITCQILAQPWIIFWSFSCGCILKGRSWALAALNSSSNILVPCSSWWGKISSFFCQDSTCGRGCSKLIVRGWWKGASSSSSWHAVHMLLMLKCHYFWKGFTRQNRFWRLSEGMTLSLSDAWSFQPPGVPKIRPPWIPGLCGGAMLP